MSPGSACRASRRRREPCEREFVNGRRTSRRFRARRGDRPQVGWSKTESSKGTQCFPQSRWAHLITDSGHSAARSETSSTGRWRARPARIRDRVRCDRAREPVHHRQLHAGRCHHHGRGLHCIDADGERTVGRGTVRGGSCGTWMGPTSAIRRGGGRAGLIERVGPRFGISAEAIEAGDEYFDRRGPATIIFARFVAVMKNLAPTIAGASR